MSVTKEVREAVRTLRTSPFVLVRIYVQNCEVRSEIVTPLVNQHMHMWDDEMKDETEAQQRKAAQNTELIDGNRADRFEGGRVNAQDYHHEPEYDHAGIHLRSRDDDQILWFSDQAINFKVHVNRDPELVNRKAQEKERPKLTPDKGIENPFVNDFPLVSFNGAPVCSGKLNDDPEVKKQKYYKYSVEVEGITKPLDPHIEGHWD